MRISLRFVGMFLVILSIVMFVITYNFSVSMLTLIDGGHIVASCLPYTGCPHLTVVNHAYTSYGIALIIFFVGILLFFTGDKTHDSDKKDGQNVAEIKMDTWKSVLSNIEGDEKKVYENVMSSDGVIFQSELVEKTEFNKIKVSRILDKLEAKGLLERKRRGMSNAVVLK